jgi:hypothetical protein
MPPKISEHMTIGIRKGIGNIHINSGVMMSAPPKPLNRLMNPPRTAAKMNRQIKDRFSKIRESH